MDVKSYFESVGQEIGALKHRVRHLIADSHWQTDGEWKESVLRQMLRRHLPEIAVVGRGFVVSGDGATHQIDILIHDASKPVLFRDGDLAIVTPDAVLGIIEVKARVSPATFGAAVRKIAGDIDLVRLHPNTRAFAALFSFEAEQADPMRYLGATAAAAHCQNERLDFCAIGPDCFHRYWNEHPEETSRPYWSWHSYHLPGLAPGYFVHNVVDAVSPHSVFHNNDVWFPVAGKESHRNAVVRAAWAQ
ncbi:MAG: hypothetical protein HY694_15235 [Deltaproteobacteria bacterium]|nr:hypothetical protein [Deltaproteobacteria bacterium]